MKFSSFGGFTQPGSKAAYLDSQEWTFMSVAVHLLRQMMDIAENANSTISGT